MYEHEICVGSVMCAGPFVCVYMHASLSNCGYAFASIHVTSKSIGVRVSFMRLCECA